MEAERISSSDLVFDDEDVVVLPSCTTHDEEENVRVDTVQMNDAQHIESDLPPLIPMDDTMELSTSDHERDTISPKIACDAQWWLSLPAPSRRDKAMILHLIRYASVLPPKISLEDQFPEELWLDRDIVLAFCQRDDLAKLHSEREFVVPKKFTSDKLIMLAYCGKVPGALQHCSVDLRSDPQIVRAAVQLDGTALQYVGPELLEDRDFIRLACQSNACALAYCLPGPALQGILNDQEFMVQMLEHTPKALDILWKLAPDYLKQNDPEFVRLALKAGLVLDEVPPHMLVSEYLEENQELAQTLILAHPHCYLTLPEEMARRREDLAHRALVSTNSDAEIHFKALEYFPQLPSQRRDVVMSISKRGDLSLLEDILVSHPKWADDEEVIQPAIGRDERFTKLASKRLRMCWRRRRDSPNAWCTK